MDTTSTTTSVTWTKGLGTGTGHGSDIGHHRSPNMNTQGTHGNTEEVSYGNSVMKPATYDGTGSWVNYKAHFEACSEINM